MKKKREKDYNGRVASSLSLPLELGCSVYDDLDLRPPLWPHRLSDTAPTPSWRGRGRGQKRGGKIEKKKSKKRGKGGNNESVKERWSERTSQKHGVTNNRVPAADGKSSTHRDQ